MYLVCSENFQPVAGDRKREEKENYSTFHSTDEGCNTCPTLAGNKKTKDTERRKLETY